MKNKKIGRTIITAAVALAVTAQPAFAAQSARWVGSGDSWQVKSADGSDYLKNTWFQDDVTGHWYMLGAGDGTLMYAGLVTDQATGKTYLLNTEHDGTYGRMLTVNGTYTLNGHTVTLQFDQDHTGAFGAVTTGLADVRNAGVQESTFAEIPVAQEEQSDANNETSNSGNTGNWWDEIQHGVITGWEDNSPALNN